MSPNIRLTKHGRWASTGRVLFHSETGTEGGWWAFETSDLHYRHGTDDLVDGECPWGENHCPVSLGHYHLHARYEGLRVLKDGDGIAIIDEKNPYLGAILREDSLQFSEMTVFEESVFCLWTHNHPIRPSIPVETWAFFFMNEFQAILQTDEFPFMDEEGWRARWSSELDSSPTD